MKQLIFLLFISSQMAFSQTHLQSGDWLGSLDLGVEKLPIRFGVLEKKGKLMLEIRNAKERILVKEVTQEGDSICAKMPIFDSEFCLKMAQNGKQLTGIWFNHARKDKNKLPFVAEFVGKQANKTTKASFSVTGKWEVHFSPEKPDETTPAIGEFVQKGNHVTGTFLTETGDYRFLEGEWNEKESNLRLSCFDGSHAFLFTAEKEGENLKGMFYSGAHWQETWEAKRIAGNKADFVLKSADSLTYLKPGYDKIAFSFPDLNHKKVSLSDAKYQNKVVIIQIMGSWCPNCMDETKLFTEWYKKYHAQGLEIIALAYERSEDFQTAAKNVSRLQQHFGAGYDFLIAGTSSKTAAATTLPMLNEIVAYPTAIILDRKGNINTIHTGFSGPGTGQHYLDFVKEKTALLEKLLAK